MSRRFETPYHGEQTGALVGSQNNGWLVQDQDAGIARQRLENFDCCCRPMVEFDRCASRDRSSC